MFESDRGNWVHHDYPPVYYWFHGIFVGGDVTDSAMLMRIVNVLLFVGLLAAIYILVPAGLRPPLLGGAFFIAVPLEVFLVPSNNPSGWAILSAIALPVALLGFLRTQGRRRWALGGLAVLALLMGAGARADAATYAVVGIGAVLVIELGRPQRLADLRSIALPAALVLAAVIAFFSVGQSAAVAPTAAGSDGPRVPHTLAQFASDLVNVPSLWTGALGGWGLGWLDTPMPGIVVVGASAVFAMVLFVAIAGTKLRPGIAVSLVALAALVVPTYFLFSHSLVIGEGVQPRYILPLLAMLVVVALVRPEGSAFSMTTGQRWIVVAILSLANLFALHDNIRRYVTGVDSQSFNLDKSIEWWWHIPLSPNGLWILGSLAFAAAFVLLSSDLVHLGVDQTAVTGEGSAGAKSAAGRHARPEPILTSAA